MYNVSAEYLRKLHTNSHVEHCRGTINGIPFNDSNIISMNYTNRCTDTDDINLGSCYVGQIDAEFINVGITRGTWYYSAINIEVGLELDDGTTEWVPLGVFRVTEAEWGDVSVHVLAADNILRLESTEFEGNLTQLQAGELYDLATFACRRCGLNFGLTKAETEALPNGMSIFTLFKDNGFKTYRDYMGALAQLAAGFVMADRQGNIIIKTFVKPQQTVDTITAFERITGVKFSDYQTYYPGVSLEVNNGNIHYSIGGGTGVIELGQQMFLQLGLEDTIRAYTDNISQAVRTIRTTPFNFSTLSTIIYDLGDYITAGTQQSTGWGPFSCLICSINWTFRELTEFDGYGRNPDIKLGKSKEEKQISTISGRIDSNEFSYYTYNNIAELNILADTETEVGNILFTSNKNTDVNISTEIKFNAFATVETEERVPVYQDTPDPLDPSGDPITSEIGYWIKTITENITAHVRYYLDDALIIHEPIETMSEDGWHTLHYGYLLHGIDESEQHTWRVTLELGNGAGVIPVEGILLTLGGQGLVGDERWDGTVTASDQVPTAKITGLKADQISDDGPTIMLHTPQTVTASDQVPAEAIAGLQPDEITEGNINIILANVLFNFVTEDKTANITVEDKTANITTEDN